MRRKGESSAAQHIICKELHDENPQAEDLLRKCKNSYSFSYFHLPPRRTPADVLRFFHMYYFFLTVSSKPTTVQKNAQILTFHLLPDSLASIMEFLGPDYDADVA